MSDLNPTVQTIAELTKQYYKNIKVEIDKEKIERVIANNLATYDNPHVSNYKLPLNLTRSDEIELLLQTNNFVKNKGICKYLREYNSLGLQNLPVMVQKYLEQGYKVVSPAEYNLLQAFKDGFLIMIKPQEMIDDEVAEITQGIKDLFEEKAALERKELMSIEKATAYAKKKQAEQQAEYDLQVTKAAQAEAQQTADMFNKYGEFINSLSLADYHTFGDVAEIVGGSNAEIEQLLNYCGFVSVRKYISSGKQATVWIKAELADTYDYKTITL